MIGAEIVNGSKGDRSRAKIGRALHIKAASGAAVAEKAISAAARFISAARSRCTMDETFTSSCPLAAIRTLASEEQVCDDQ